MSWVGLWLIGWAIGYALTYNAPQTDLNTTDTNTEITSNLQNTKDTDIQK